jgi:hypothetical protein
MRIFKYKANFMWSEDGESESYKLKGLIIIKDDSLSKSEIKKLVKDKEIPKVHLSDLFSIKLKEINQY